MRLYEFCLLLLYVHGRILIKSTLVHRSKAIFWIEAAPFNGVGTVIAYLYQEINSLWMNEVSKYVSKSTIKRHLI